VEIKTFPTSHVERDFLFGVNMKEFWRNVVGYEGWYSVSNLGRIRRERNGGNTHIGKILSLQKQRYTNVPLTKNSITKTKTIHVLVAQAFLGERPKGFVINHKDGIRKNNSVYNLEYITQMENIKHAIRNNLNVIPKGEQCGSSKLKENDIRNIRKIYQNNKYTQKELGIMFNIHEETVGTIVRKTSWKHI